MGTKVTKLGFFGSFRMFAQKANTHRKDGDETKKTILNPIFNDIVTFVQTCTGSKGKITDLEVTLMPKGRNVLHCHAYTQKFTAIDGDLGLETRESNERF